MAKVSANAQRYSRLVGGPIVAKRPAPKAPPFRPQKGAGGISRAPHRFPPAPKLNGGNHTMRQDQGPHADNHGLREALANHTMTAAQAAQARLNSHLGHDGIKGNGGWRNSGYPGALPGHPGEGHAPHPPIPGHGGHLPGPITQHPINPGAGGGGILPGGGSGPPPVAVGANPGGYQGLGGIMSILQHGINQSQFDNMGAGDTGGNGHPIGGMNGAFSGLSPYAVHFLASSGLLQKNSPTLQDTTGLTGDDLFKANLMNSLAGQQPSTYSLHSGIDQATLAQMLSQVQGGGYAQGYGPNGMLGNQHYPGLPVRRPMLPGQGYTPPPGGAYPQ